MSHRRAWLLALPGAAIAVTPLAFGLVRGPTLDASVFSVIAEEMRAGAVPYRDLFDHKPPIGYVVLWAAGMVAPFLDAWTRTWAATVIAMLGTLLLLASWLGPRWPLGTFIALATASPLLGAEYFAQGGGQTESLAVLPATAGFLVAVRARPPSATHAFAAGLLVAVAGATSLQVAPVALGVLVAIALAGGRGRAVTSYVAGGVAVGIVLLGWLTTLGALPAALDQLVVYNRAYLAGQTLFHPIPLLNLSVAVLVLAPLVSAAAVRVTELVVRRDGEPAELGALVAIIAWAGLLVVQGQFIGHYAIVLAAPLVVLAVPVLDRLGIWLVGGRTRPLVAIAVTLSVALPLVAVGTTESGPWRRPVIDEAARAVERLTPAGSHVFVWGNEPLVYLLSGRGPAGPYSYLFPLMKSGYTSDSAVAALLESWQLVAPAAFVDASIHPDGPSSAPLLGRPPAGADAIADRLDPLREFVRVRYRPASMIATWTIYVPN